MNIIQISFKKSDNKFILTTMENGDILAELYTSADKKYSEEVSNVKEIIRECDNYYSELNDKLDAKEKELINKNKKDLLSGKNVYYEADCIHIFGTYDEIITFLDNNIELTNKKIVIEKVSYKENDYEAIKKLSKYKNINVKADHDIGCISIEQYLEVYEKINLIKKGIKKYNLSPIEQLMYTYDIVRDRVYVEENDYESSQVSRSLSSILTGDKIVCAGFANIFDEIAKQLGFKSMVYTLQFGEEYHARNMVYVKDEKYNINGIYFFDPTWDCKKENNDYLKSYKFFARTKSEMDVIHKSSNEDCVFLSPKIGEQYHINIDNAYFLKTILKLHELIIGVKPDFIKVTNHDLEIEKKFMHFLI